MKSLSERFWEKVIVRGDEDCWPWLASLHTGGYGMIGGPKQSVLHAHRVSWEIHNGAIPAGMSVLHRCDTPSCTNPNHLFLGTSADNMADMNRKGRHWRKFSHYEIAFAKMLRSLGMNYREIMSFTGLSKTHLSRVVRGKSPKQVAVCHD